MIREIDAMFFDVGNVLLAYSWDPAYKVFASLGVSCMEDVRARLKEPLLEYERGDITPHKFYELCIRAAGITRPFSFEDFVAILGNGLSVNPGIRNVLKAIRPEIKKFIVSNNNSVNWEHARARCPEIGLFFSHPTQCVLSHEIHILKPHLDFFKEALCRAGCTPERILYIDDVLSYAEYFRSLGGNAFTYDCRFDSLDYLLQGLADFDVLRNAYDSRTLV